MAYVVERKPGRAGQPDGARRFEVRESVATDRGPRARSLATFAVLDDAVIARARARALRPLDAAEVIAAARRLGAPVAAGGRAERAARELLAAVAEGDHVPPVLAALVGRVLAPGAAAVSDAIDDTIEEVAAWIGASPERRGEAIADLLALAEAMTAGREIPEPSPFPRISSQ